MPNAFEKLPAAKAWKPPVLPESIPQGDMPGDCIHIGQEHIDKANVIFPELLKTFPQLMGMNPHHRVVLAVCGGSGVGKSETASLLSCYLRCLGLGSYTLSGDNYPRRTPQFNDAERLRIFRQGGLNGLVTSGQYTAECCDALRLLQVEERDADTTQAFQQPWVAIYQREGKKALAGYLGTNQEIEFEKLTAIITQFKNGADAIYLKRMGRLETELWYEAVDFSAVNVLVLEWTHGNSDHFSGVDYVILLNSTPSETLAYRKARHRDGGADSPFTTMVLGLEQKILEMQASKANLILSKSGEVLSYRDYRRYMAEE
ncbi:MAG: adenylylsulfate kinase [Eubacteriales bacterium]|nr:adenylylsulfate kinase [Eubacteriales bacterium]